MKLLKGIGVLVVVGIILTIVVKILWILLPVAVLVGMGILIWKKVKPAGSGR